MPDSAFIQDYRSTISELPADQKTAMAMDLLETMKQNIRSQYGRCAVTLRHVLAQFDGGKYPLTWHYGPDKQTIVYETLGTEHVAPVFEDDLSGERTAFLLLPLQYLHHDALINPRGLNLSIRALVEELASTNPQLHSSLARMEDGYVRIFDGQHKAVARILLGSSSIVVRVFLEPDVGRLMDANTRAGSQLRQVEFDAGMETRLRKNMFQEKIRNYQDEHGMDPNDLSWLTPDMVNKFLGRIRN